MVCGVWFTQTWSFPATLWWIWVVMSAACIVGLGQMPASSSKGGHAGISPSSVLLLSYAHVEAIPRLICFRQAILSFSTSSGPKTTSPNVTGHSSHGALPFIEELAFMRT